MGLRFQPLPLWSSWKILSQNNLDKQQRPLSDKRLPTLNTFVLLFKNLMLSLNSYEKMAENYCWSIWSVLMTQAGRMPRCDSTYLMTSFLMTCDPTCLMTSFLITGSGPSHLCRLHLKCITWANRTLSCAILVQSQGSFAVIIAIKILVHLAPGMCSVILWLLRAASFWFWFVAGTLVNGLCWCIVLAIPQSGFDGQVCRCDTGCLYQPHVIGMHFWRHYSFS